MGSLKELDEKMLDIPEELIITESCRVKEDGGKEMRVTHYGDAVTVAGLDKLQLLSSGRAMYPEDFKKLQKEEKSAKDKG